MSASESNWSRRYGEYWAAEGRERAVAQLAATCCFALISQIAFIGLDRWAFPDQFRLFLTMRMLVNVGIVAIILWGRHRFPRICQLALATSVASEILVMIVASGGSQSLYFAGLIIVLVGMPVLLLVRLSESLIVSGFCVAGFIASAFATAGGGNERAFTIQTVFILCAALESAFSTHAISSNRLESFEQRREIEKARDQLASLDDAKNRFTANVHHELRTPLTLMLAPLETLRGGDLGELDAPVQKTLRTMHVNGQRLLKLINNLLDLAKLESDRFEIHRRKVDLEAILSDVVEGARPMADRKGVELGFEWGAGDSQIYADRDAIEKVIVNLLGNALKFTEGGGRVDVIVDADRDGGTEGVVVRVKDSGIGLSPEDVDRVFDRFAQVDASATRKHEGTGIGLSLAKELVELHGGRIWAESEGEGLGTTMNFSLPPGEPDSEVEEEVLAGDGGEGLALRRSLADLEQQSLDEEDRSREGHSIGLDLERTVDRWESQHEGGVGSGRVVVSDSRPNVVVADDNREMRELLSFLLGREFAIHVARNGREALDLTRRIEPDLVVTDIMMPEMSGTELCREIKSDPDLALVPVMLVSSKAESEMKVEGLELGADDYVTKPFHPRELMARARGLVRLRVLQREIEGRNEALEKAMQELKNAEVQLVQSERLAAVGELAAGVAHEVNNPVNFALNAVRVLRSEIGEIREVAQGVAELDWDDASKREGQLASLHRRLGEIGVDEAASTVDELSAIIADGLERTYRLVGDLRDFAAPHRGARVEVDLEQGIRSTAALLGPTIAGQGAEIVLDLPDPLPRVQGDPGALNQLFLNLIKNAAEAVGDRGGRVEISAEPDAAGVRIRFDDDGPGISSEALDQLFEPFYTTKEAGGGTGLGLSISRQIVEEHGGTIEARSEEGAGSSFEVWLPLEGVPSSGEAAVDGSQATATPPNER